MHATELRSELRASRARLFSAIDGLGEEQFRHVAGASGWNIAAHLAHLLRVERLFVDRAQRALTEDAPHLASTSANNDDDPAIAQKLAVPQIVHGMQATRRELDTLLAGCDDAALERAIVHELRGRMTVGQIAAKMTAHEAEHAALVEVAASAAKAARATAIPLMQADAR